MIRLGYDIGGMSIRVCLLDDQTFQIINQQTRNFPLGQGEDVFVKQLVEMANEISESQGLMPEEHFSIGIGIPGTVHHETGVLLSACNLNLKGVSIADRLREHFPNAKIAVGNDADVAALAEHYAGVFQGYKSALLITIGTGIGGGLIINNRLFQGGLGFGCELGHIVLQQDGLMCSCGNRGCAETLCSASWLEREGRRSLIDYPMSRIAILAQGKPESVRAKDIIEAAQAGDGIARQIFEKYVENLTALIVTCSYVLGPEIEALGGGVSNAGNFLLEPLRLKVAHRSRHYMPDKIVTAKLGNTAGMIGAALLPCAVEEGMIKSYCL
jgi:glucokinase